LCRFEIGNGENARFWEDRWVNDRALKDDFPRSYNLCFDKNKSVKYMFDKGLGNVNFRRTLYGDSLEQWEHIKDSRSGVVLSGDRDRIFWTLDKKGIYTVKCYYRFLIENGIKYPHKFLRKTKMPPRVKVFIWLVLRNCILTRGNLLRRGWV
jgi:hypothetical protein